MERNQPRTCQPRENLCLPSAPWKVKGSHILGGSLLHVNKSFDQSKSLSHQLGLTCKKFSHSSKEKVLEYASEQN